MWSNYSYVTLQQPHIHTSTDYWKLILYFVMCVTKADIPLETLYIPQWGNMKDLCQSVLSLVVHEIKAQTGTMSTIMDMTL